MSIPDYAKTVKQALAAEWVSAHPTWVPTLEVDEHYTPVPGHPTVLVADDTGAALLGGAWLVDHTPRRPLLRLTAFAAGRDEARTAVVAAADYVRAHRPGISRVEDVSDPLITRDRDTGAVLASITVRVIVKQPA